MAPLSTEDVVLLVRRKFEYILSGSVSVLLVYPEEGKGWAVFVEHGGIVWKQSVFANGTLGPCYRQYPEMEWVKH
ncbi:MAG: hypothetical protein AB7G75_13005 [Candidatus Binatia bacterium]